MQPSDLKVCYSLINSRLVEINQNLAQLNADIHEGKKVDKDLLTSYERFKELYAGIAERIKKELPKENQGNHLAGL